MTSDNPRLIANWQPTSVSELIDGKPIDAPLRNMAPLALRVPMLPVRPESRPSTIPANIATVVGVVIWVMVGR